MPIRYLKHLTHIPCRIKVLWGVNPRFHGLYPGIRQVAYALLTRAPVAIKVLLPHDAPRLACVKPVASVHPEPGSNSSLYLFFFFIIPSKRYLTELTSFSLLFLYYTCFFNSFNELFLSLTAAPWPPRFAKVLQRYCLSLLHSKFFSMFFLNYFLNKI